MDRESREIIHRKIARTGPDTERGVFNVEGSLIGEKDVYYHILGFSNNEEMFAWLKGKDVLNIGSGFGFFALDIMKAKGRDFANIISLNPNLANPKFREVQEGMVHYQFRYFNRGGRPMSEAEVDNLLKEVQKRSVAASWDSKYVINTVNGQEIEAEKNVWSELPFADESFDRIVSSFAFPFYAHGDAIQEMQQWGKKKKGSPISDGWEVGNKKREISTNQILREEAKEEVIRVLKSIIRILKPGGECRLSPVNNDFQTSGQGILKVMVEKGLLKNLGADIKIEKSGKGQHSYCLIKKSEKTVE